MRGSNILRKGSFSRNNSSKTVTDSTTQLMWSDSSHGLANIADALETCSSLTLAGFSNWRLANINELASLVMRKQSFGGTWDDTFTSDLSSTRLLSSTQTGSGAPHYWFVNGQNGYVSKDINAENTTFSFKCVRDN